VSKQKVILSWLPALIFMGIIFYLSSLPGNEIKLPNFTMSDKVVHFLAYGLLGWLISFRRWLTPMPASINWNDKMGQITGILYAASDELHQMFVPMRESSILDWTADALGVAFGSWICRKMLMKYATK
jgi:VanZ family protein